MAQGEFYISILIGTQVRLFGNSDQSTVELGDKELFGHPKIVP